MAVIERSVLVVLPANNFNEQEYRIVIELLKKKGIAAFIASDADSLCKGKSGLKIKADVNLYNVNEKNFGGVVFIGGRGVKDYWENRLYHQIAVKFNNAGKIVAAVCSAPVILAKAGILNNKRATCYAQDKNMLIQPGIEYIDKPVVEDGSIITAQGEEAAVEFTSSFINLLLNKKTY